MSLPIQIVAQRAMDLYYGNYKSSNDFYNLDDFVFYVGSTIAEFFSAEYRNQYNELRALNAEEIVTFSLDWLNKIELEVKLVEGRKVAQLPEKPFSFAFDTQSTGVQRVAIIAPKDQCSTLERTTLTSMWQLCYLPNTNVIFFAVDQDKIEFKAKGNCGVTKVVVYYVPSISSEMEVPDGIVDYAVINCVKKMKTLLDGNLIKKSIDQNQNKTMETEIDKLQLK